MLYAGHLKSQRTAAYYHAAIQSRNWRPAHLQRFIETGEPPAKPRPLPRDPEVDRLVAEIKAGGTLKIDAEGKPYVES